MLELVYENMNRRNIQLKVAAFLTSDSDEAENTFYKQENNFAGFIRKSATRKSMRVVKGFLKQVQQLHQTTLHDKAQTTSHIPPNIATYKS
jgi:hypothetical protein